MAESARYPYFLQQFGKSVWNEAASSPIRLTDARVGTSEVRRSLDAGFFRSRWDRATMSEQKYLRAMIENGDRGSVARDIAARLGRKVQSIGPSRFPVWPLSFQGKSASKAQVHLFGSSTTSMCFTFSV